MAVQAAAKPAQTFAGYEGFLLAVNAARKAAIAVFGERWDLHPQAYLWARLPAEWVRVRVAGRATPLALPPRFDPVEANSWNSLREPLPDEVIGQRWSRAPRDQKLPIARFWPDGQLPVGPDYALGVSTAKPSKPRLVHNNPEPQKPRRPSGVGLPSGRERADGDFYIEPRWLVDALLAVETLKGGVHDPFCGGGNIIGACLERNISAAGSDRYDRGFGDRYDAFDIDTPCENLLSNPPFALIDKIIPHFLPLVRHKLILLARLNILEGQERRSLFDATPPARVWVSSRRASIPPGDLAHPRDRFGAMNPLPASGGSTAFCWVVWDREHVGPTTLGWL
jgi:hypothetical protein